MTTLHTQSNSEDPSESRSLALVLASASPRRSALLQQAGVAFTVVPADIAELERAGEQPVALAERLAGEKALAVARSLPASEPRLVLGADTIVVLGDAVLGKPVDPKHALEMLSRLTGHTHRVITGIAVAHSRTLALRSRWVESTVEMRSAERQELVDYIAGGEPMDKAGSYALQGEGRRFVRSVVGSESNVIGLPLEETLELLERAGAADAGEREPA